MRYEEQDIKNIQNLLDGGKTYREIIETTKISSATLSKMIKSGVLNKATKENIKTGANCTCSLISKSKINKGHQRLSKLAFPTISAN